jgi:hypothetical protein
MKRPWMWAAALLLLLASATAWGAKVAPARGAGKGPRLATVTFGVRHRVFHEFRDLHTVKLNETFPLGDSDYSARVVQYLADFQMDLQAHKIWSMSDEPRNPAFRVIVWKGKTPQDTTWAFLKSPPHFGAHSYFAFQVLRIDFVNHAPLLADTTSAHPPAPMSAPTAPADSAKSR